MNSSRIWALQVDPVVYKFLNTIPRKDAERILFAIERLPLDPFMGDVQKMSGEDNVWRKRTGSYRIRFEIIKSERVIHVFRAERRTSTTY